MRTINKNRVRDYYELYADINPVYGGLWANPDQWTMLEVIDLDSASGVNGCVLVQEGSAYVDENRIKGGLQVTGQEDNKALFDSIKRVYLDWDRRSMYIYHLFLESHPVNSHSHNMLLIGMEMSYTYGGFDGPCSDDSWIIIPKKTRFTNDWDSYTWDQGHRIAEEWRANMILTTNVEKSLRQLLRERGVELRRNNRR